MVTRHFTASSWRTLKFLGEKRQDASQRTEAGIRAEAGSKDDAGRSGWLTRVQVEGGKQGRRSAFQAESGAGPKFLISQRMQPYTPVVPEG